MNSTNSFEQFLRQFSELQKGLFTTLTSTVPSGQSFNPLNLSENLDKTLKFQEEVVAGSLEFQAQVARMSIETQKQFWEGYFNTMRKGQIKKDE